MPSCRITHPSFRAYYYYYYYYYYFYYYYHYYLRRTWHIGQYTLTV
jgi:hypothetical protein